MSIEQEARKAIEATYTATMHVLVETLEKDAESPFYEPVIVQEIQDVPCRFSRGERPKIVSSDVVASGDYSPIIYFSPGTVIPPGSTLTVTDENGYTYNVKQTGAIFTNYMTHWEMPVKLEVNA